jgi:hypothetical protein
MSIHVHLHPNIVSLKLVLIKLTQIGQIRPAHISVKKYTILVHCIKLSSLCMILKRWDNGDVHQPFTSFSCLIKQLQDNTSFNDTIFGEQVLFDLFVLI